jgi:hypothetical protein
MATFYKFGKLWEIPPAAARLDKSRPANTQAFETLLTNLEPVLSNFITAHPRCPKDPDLPAVRYAIKQFMEEQAPSNFFKERWAASYDPARKVTYVSWFLSTITYFLDKLDFTSLVPPPVETEFPVFIAELPSAPLDPPPQCNQAPVTSSSRAASRNLVQSVSPAAPAAPAAKPGRQSRLWNAGGPAGLAALEARNAAERQAQLRQRPQRLRPQDPAPSAPAPAATEQRDAPANPTTKLFSCARTTRTTPTRSPQPFNSSSRKRATPTRPSDRNAPKLPPSLQSENPGPAAQPAGWVWAFSDEG